MHHPNDDEVRKIRACEEDFRSELQRLVERHDPGILASTLFGTGLAIWRELKPDTEVARHLYLMAVQVAGKAVERRPDDEPLQ
ncbi:MAG: hypothetical protein EA356_14965 [Geminicoccaceae bacterium]|nr:MAG: hypothetical protein EA356_14965 [Geminicoccaceae bacterium]